MAHDNYTFKYIKKRKDREMTDNMRIFFRLIQKHQDYPDKRLLVYEAIRAVRGEMQPRAIAKNGRTGMVEIMLSGEFCKFECMDWRKDD